MSVKLRLQRKGRKKQPFYYIVVADSRAPRDGRFIDRVGSYNPNTDPATVNLDVDRSVDWLQKGAQPTDTVRAILSYKGVMYKHHLLRGVAKGVVKEEDVEDKFNAWLQEKESKIEAKKEAIASATSSKKAADLEREAAIRAEREKEIQAKNSPLTEEVEGTEGEESAAEATEAEATEAVAEEATTEEAPAAEETAEAPAAEEAPAEEPTTEEAPAEEPAAEETAEEEPKAEESAEEKKEEEEEPKA